MTVSVAMIVKDEESVLGRCLESIAIAVDEIVIVDTGSTDATKEVARQYTDRIFDLTWRKDFAGARQYAFDRTTGDWVFWLDADDIVRHAERIRPLLAHTPSQVGLVFWKYQTAWDAHGNVMCEYWRERCVRNDGTFRWVGRIHEFLQAAGSVLYSDEVVIEHQPEPNRPRLERNLDIMESVRGEEGESPRLLYYLGRDAMTAGQIERALETFGRYVQIAVWDDEKYQAQTKIAELLRIQGRHGEALDADLIALKIHPTWPDAYFGLAKTYYFLQDWPKVVHWSEFGEMLAQPNTIAIINPLDYSFNWIIYYTVALYHVGRREDGLLWTREALAVVPDDPWHMENERLFAGLVSGGAARTSPT